MNWVIKLGPNYYSWARVWVGHQSGAWRFCCRGDALYAISLTEGRGRLVRLRPTHPTGGK